MDQAACVEYDPEMWFPIGRRLTSQVRVALAICQRCPVSMHCDLYRREIKPSTGIWAGRWIKDMKGTDRLGDMVQKARTPLRTATTTPGLGAERGSL